MDKKPNFNKRFTRPQTLASAFGGVLKIFGARASDADLAARWDEIMGSNISKIAKLIGIKKSKEKKFNIVVRPVNPAFALQLSYMTDDIKDRINKYFGYLAVDKITIRK